jgi:hypothetical protein
MEAQRKEAPEDAAVKKRKVFHARKEKAQRDRAQKRPARSRRARDGAAPELPLRARLERQSERLFRACSIVEACFRASASLYPPKDPEFMVPALEAVQEVIGDVAGEIDEIAEDLPPKRRAIPDRDK